MKGRRERKIVTSLDDSSQLLVCEGKRESAAAIKISGMKEVLLLSVYLICGSSFDAAEGKEERRWKDRWERPWERCQPRDAHKRSMPLALTPWACRGWE